MESITKENLIKNGWNEIDFFKDGKLITYNKTINDFHYTVSFTPDYGNWSDWQVHIDNPEFETVGRCEVKYFDDIDKLSMIYKN